MLLAKLGSIELARYRVCTLPILPSISISDHPVLAVFVGLKACTILTAGITAQLVGNWPFWASSLLGNDTKALLEAGSAGAVSARAVGMARAHPCDLSVQRSSGIEALKAWMSLEPLGRCMGMGLP